MNDADFRKLVEANLLQQKLYDDVTKDVPTTGEQVKLRHILVAVRTPAPTPAADGNAGSGCHRRPRPPRQASTATPTPAPTLAPRTEAEALADRADIKKKLDAGEDFKALAIEYSDDAGSKAAGGELGWYAQGRRAWSRSSRTRRSRCRSARSASPVKTQFGYHIIQVEEKDPNRELNAYIVSQKKSEAFQKWLTDLRNAAKIAAQLDARTSSRRRPAPVARTPIEDL